MIGSASPARQAIVIITAFTLVRCILAGLAGLDLNECYALVIGRELHLSYFDHPPLHFWIAHLSARALGETRWARLPFIAISAASSWLMFRLTERLFGDRAALWALVAFNLSGFFAIAAGLQILPDGPLNLCLLAATYSVSEIFDSTQERAASWRSWLLTGLWFGLAALAKYHAILVGLSLIAFIASEPKYRYLLAKPQIYAGMAAALLIFSPVLIWNQQHHWASFNFQGQRGLPSGGLHFGLVLQLAAAQIAFLLPWIFVPLLGASVGAFRNIRSDARRSFCLWLGVPVGLFFTLQPLWSGEGMVHWAMPGWLLLFPLLGEYLAGKTWSRRWVAASAVLLFGLAPLLVAEINTGWLGAAFPRTFRKGDPSVEFIEWTQLRDDLAKHSLLNRKKTFVVALGWRDATMIAQALGPTVPLQVFTNDARSFGYRDAPQTGDQALLIARPANVAHLLPALRRAFGGIRPIASVSIGREQRREIGLEVFSASSIAGAARVPSP